MANRGQCWRCPWCRQDCKLTSNHCSGCGTAWHAGVQIVQHGSPRHRQSPRRRQKAEPDQARQDAWTYAGNWDYSGYANQSTGPWVDQRQRTKSPRQRATKSPARQQPTKKQSKASGIAKRNSGTKALKVPDAEPDWMSFDAVDEEKESATASAEEKLHRLVAELQKSEQPLSEGVQDALTVATAVTPEESTRKMQSAVSRLSNARDQLMQARQARDNLHRSWAKFIAAAVQRWNQHGENFGKQDAKMQEAFRLLSKSSRKPRKKWRLPRKPSTSAIRLPQKFSRSATRNS